MKDEQLLEMMSMTNNINAIRISMDAEKFNKIGISDSTLFRRLKNGLHSFNGVSNRNYFKNLSGVYFSIFSKSSYEMVILFDADKSNLNRLQVITRVKRLLGIECNVEVGVYSDFEDRLKEIVSVARNSQPFGDYYFMGKSCPVS